MRRMSSFVSKKKFKEIISTISIMALGREKSLSFIKELILDFWSNKIST